MWSSTARQVAYISPFWSPIFSITNGSVLAASLTICFGSCPDILVRRWLRVENPVLTSVAWDEFIVVRVASKREATQLSGTAFVLMLDLTLLIWRTFTSTEVSVRSMASKFATCSSVTFSPIFEVVGRFQWCLFRCVVSQSREQRCAQRAPGLRLFAVFQNARYLER